MFLEDTQSIFIAKRDFRYGYDPYNTIDVLKILYSVISSPKVAREEANRLRLWNEKHNTGPAELYLRREFSDES